MKKLFFFLTNSMRFFFIKFVFIVSLKRLELLRMKQMVLSHSCLPFQHKDIFIKEHFYYFKYYAKLFDFLFFFNKKNLRRVYYLEVGNILWLETYVILIFYLIILYVPTPSGLNCLNLGFWFADGTLCA